MKYITEERLSIYSKHLKVKKEAELAAYHWNTALAGALFPAIQCLEVTLRNAIVQAVQSNPLPRQKDYTAQGRIGFFHLLSIWENEKYLHTSDSLRQDVQVRLETPMAMF